MTLTEVWAQVSGDWSARKMEMLKRWDFYYGAPQRNYLSRFGGEDDYEYVTRLESATIENHCGKTCDVLVGYLYGQPNSKSRILVRAEDENGDIVEKVQRFLQFNVWKNNDIDSFRIDTALMASVTGYGIVHLEFVDSRTMLPFPENTSKEDKKKYGTIRYDLYDSVDTIPIPYVSPSGECYPRKLGSILRTYSRDDASGVRYLDQLRDKRFKMEDIVEYFTDTTFERRVIESAMVGGDSDKSTVNMKNPYGSISIPFVVFRNYGDPMFLEGESDIANMIPLQTALNEIMTDDKACISYHSFPILKFLKNAKMPTNFIRKVNSGIEFEGEGDAEYLTWENVLEASDKFKDKLRSSMTVVSGVSQISRGNASEIGQIRSGAGLKTLFQADINAIGLKIPHFKRAERELVYATTKMWEMETGEEFGDFVCHVEFPDDFVGLDELLKAQVNQIDLQEGVASIREIVKAKHPEAISEDEISSFISEMIAEKKKIAENEAKAKNAGKPPETTNAKSNQQAVGAKA